MEKEREATIMYIITGDHEAYCGRCQMCITQKTTPFDMKYCSHCGAYFKRTEHCDSVGIMIEKMNEEWREKQ